MKQQATTKYFAETVLGTVIKIEVGAKVGDRFWPDGRIEVTGLNYNFWKNSVGETIYPITRQAFMKFKKDGLLPPKKTKMMFNVNDRVGVLNFRDGVKYRGTIRAIDEDASFNGGFRYTVNLDDNTTFFSIVCVADWLLFKPEPKTESFKIAGHEAWTDGKNLKIANLTLSKDQVTNIVERMFKLQELNQTSV
jgi:hypothetical protein